MKKGILFTLLGTFCLMLTSCGMMHKKDDHKKNDSSRKPSQRRYHSRSASDFN